MLDPAHPPQAYPVSPSRPSLVAQALMGAIKGYRLMASPWIGNSCRFTPTCSVYTEEALRLHGAAFGSYLGAKRILRCHPFCAGGHDPVPPLTPALLSSSTSTKPTAP